jgi:bleomycin hydrolase
MINCNLLKGASLTNMAISNWINTPITPIQNAVSMNSVSSIGLNSTIIDKNPYIFNNQLDYGLPITNQKSSGRCWLFASCNLIRMLAFKNLEEEFGKIEEFEISQNYLFFWDKLERYHRSLRYYIDIKKTKDNKDRYLYQLYQDPMGDGGQWDMAKEIVKKYGVVPKQVYPDTHHSKSSREMNKILTKQLKSDFVTLDSVNTEVIESAIEIMMNRVFKMLVGFLGKPPTKFNWTFKSKDSKIHTLREMTPKTFLEKIKFNPDDWISVINDPRKENAFNKYYNVKYLGNVLDRHVGWLNMDMRRVNELTKLSIDKKYPVWFGCDVGTEWDRSSGVQDPGIVDTKNTVGLDTCQDKESRLRSFASLPNHAMLITGYHEDVNKVTRWKVENSWGKSSGTDGFLLMTDKWMDEYVFQILVNKDLLTDIEKEALNVDPLVIEPWDPLGTLA